MFDATSREVPWDELAVLYRSAPIGLGVIDADLRFVRINDWLASINGMPAAAHVGRRVDEIVPDLAEQAVQALRRVLETGEPLLDLEIVGETPAEPGLKRTWLERWQPIRDGDGRIVAVSIVAEDYTERKAMEAELRSANQRKDEFLAILSHELRNPMQAITSALHLLAGSELCTSDRRAVDIITRQCVQMRRLIADLIDVNRSSGRAMGAVFTTVSLRNIVNAAVGGVEAQVRDKGQVLSVDLPDDDCMFKGDEERIAQLLTNLLTNASKYSPRGSCIWLSANVSADELVVTLRDQGLGLATDQLEQVFELFARSVQAESLAPSGLGIGLALARRIAELHGGTLRADSDGPGLGTTFTLRLPLRA